VLDNSRDALALAGPELEYRLGRDSGSAAAAAEEVATLSLSALIVMLASAKWGVRNLRNFLALA